MDPQSLAAVQQLLTQMGVITAPPSFSPVRGEDNRGSPMQAPSGGGQSGGGGGGGGSAGGGQSGGMGGAGSGFTKLLGGMNPMKLLSGFLGGGTPSAASPAGSMPVQPPTFANGNNGMPAAPQTFAPIGTNSSTPTMAPGQGTPQLISGSVGPYGALVNPSANVPASMAGTPTASLFGMFDPSGNIGGFDNTGSQVADAGSDASGGIGGGLGGLLGGDSGGLGSFGGLGSLFG